MQFPPHAGIITMRQRHPSRSCANAGINFMTLISSFKRFPQVFLGLHVPLVLYLPRPQYSYKCLPNHTSPSGGLWETKPSAKGGQNRQGNESLCLFNNVMNAKVRHRAFLEDTEPNIRRRRRSLWTHGPHAAGGLRSRCSLNHIRSSPYAQCSRSKLQTSPTGRGQPAP